MNYNKFITDLASQLNIDVEAVQNKTNQLVEQIQAKLSAQTSFLLPFLGELLPVKKGERVVVDKASGKRYLMPPEVNVSFRATDSAFEDSKEDSDSFVRQFIGNILAELKQSRRVEIDNLGVFDLTSKDGRLFVSFTASDGLSKLLNKPFAHFEKTEVKDGVTFDNIPEDDDEPVSVLGNVLDKTDASASIRTESTSAPLFNDDQVEDNVATNITSTIYPQQRIKVERKQASAFQPQMPDVKDLTKKYKPTIKKVLGFAAGVAALALFYRKKK